MYKKPHEMFLMQSLPPLCSWYLFGQNLFRQLASKTQFVFAQILQDSQQSAANERIIRWCKISRTPNVVTLAGYNKFLCNNKNKTTIFKLVLLFATFSIKNTLSDRQMSLYRSHILSNVCYYWEISWLEGSVLIVCTVDPLHSKCISKIVNQTRPSSVTVYFRQRNRT